MALPLQVDWNLIQSLYLKGLTPKQISTETGVKADTVSNRAHRFKWRKSLLNSAVVVQRHNSQIQETPEDSPALAKQSQRVRSGLASVLERSIDKLEQLSFKTPKAALKANAELESVVRNAAKVFGWTEGHTQPLVRIDVVNNALTLSEQANVPRLGEEPVIEQESDRKPLQPSSTTPL